MERWDVLVEKTVHILGVAHGYLEGQRSRVQSPEEREFLDQWVQWWGDRSSTIGIIRGDYAKGRFSPYVAVKDAPVFVHVSEQIDLTGRHLAGLGEQRDFGHVGAIFAVLEQQVRALMSVGPHGPGEGLPRPPSGRSR